jgi:hypothetical protein
MLNMNINFADGVYTNGKINGIEIAILSSYEKANDIIDYLKEAVDAGYNPNDVDIDYSDIEEVDLRRIKRTIEDYCN